MTISKERQEAIQKEIEIKISLIFSLADVQEHLITDIKSLGTEIDIYKFNIKKQVNAIKRSTEIFRSEFNNTFHNNDDRKLVFGEASDVIKDLIYNLVGYGFKQ